MSMKITNDLRANVAVSSVEIISLHGGSIVVDEDEFPALIAFLQSAQQSFSPDTSIVSPNGEEWDAPSYSEFHDEGLSALR
jgi:hypothetical protein